MLDLKERVNILKQGVELGQKGGAFTLDDAYYAKQALDAIGKGVSIKEAFEILVKLVVKAQKAGIYTLKDAYVIYAAVENYESLFIQQPPTPEPQPEPQPQPVKRGTKKESN
jgi:hypothetical protein